MESMAAEPATSAEPSVIGSFGSGPIVICDSLQRKCNIAAMLRICSNLDCANLLLVQDLARGIFPKESNILHEAGPGRFFWRDGRTRVVKPEEVESLLPKDCVVFGVDTSAGAVSMFDKDLCTEHETRQSCFIFGNETDGISKSLLRLCDAFIYIPCPGSMKSLNVSQCAVVVLFEWARQRNQGRRPSAMFLHSPGTLVGDGDKEKQEHPIASSGDDKQEEAQECLNTPSWFDFFSSSDFARSENGFLGSGPIVICDNLPSTNRGGLGPMIRLCCNIDCAALLLVQDEGRNVSKDAQIFRRSHGRAFWKSGGIHSVGVTELQAFLPADRIVLGVRDAPGAADVFGTELCPASQTCKSCFIFNTAPEGISEALLGLCDTFVSVDCPGSLKSMHVEQVAAVVLSQWLRQRSQRRS